MEVLSTGEKIKRARVYKGFTLKDLCGGKISISKMSCIENDKIKPEREILDFISSKLGINAEYLKEDIDGQIYRNVQELESNKNVNDYEKKLQYNLNAAVNYKYFNIASRISHIMFNYYIDNSKDVKLQNLISMYYDCCKMSSNEKNHAIYYMDMARYLYINCEYIQSLSYYENAFRMCKNKYKNNEILVNADCGIAYCYLMMEDIKQSSKIAKNLEKLINNLSNDIDRAKIYLLLSLLSLKQGKLHQFCKYEKLCMKFSEYDKKFKAEAEYSLSDAMFKINMNEKAKMYILDSIKDYPIDSKRDLTEFMLKSAKLIVNNNLFKEAEIICSDALNYSISIDDNYLIEKTYYLKAYILIKQKKINAAEIYINLSLDVLERIGSEREIYNRYLEIGNMYYISGNVSESLKYFALALSYDDEI